MDDRHIKMIAKEGSKEETVCGRLVGFINDSECKAIINSADAARKIFTSESVLPSDFVGKIIGSRFVFATYEFGGKLGDEKNFDRKIFISPVIKSVAYVSGSLPQYNCGKKTFILNVDGDKDG